MKSIEILVKEHHLIQRYIDILDLLKGKLEKGANPDVSFFKQAIQFSKEYADRFHHLKEEYVMFGLLAQKKEGALDGQIGELRYQHERCRHCMHEIEKSIQDENNIDEMKVTHLLGHLSGYISLLKRHIYREDHIFFPLAQKTLTREDDEYLMSQFAIQEKNLGGEGFTDSMKTILEQINAFVLGK